MLGKTARGRLTVFFGSIIIAEVALSISVEADQRVHASAEPTVAAHSMAYRKIFASYSHLDGDVVDQVQHITRSLGDDYLRDVKDLRAGEIWSARLEKMIHEADVFQLFWSSNSMRSRFVRQEWECAIALQRENFVRPTYWEDPLPEAPNEDLPPESLRSLHFYRLPGLAVPPARSTTHGLPPLPAASEAPSTSMRHPESAPEVGARSTGSRGLVFAAIAIVLLIVAIAMLRMCAATGHTMQIGAPETSRDKIISG